LQQLRLEQLHHNVKCALPSLEGDFEHEFLCYCVAHRRE
jgi:hypothetical protein